MNHESLPARTIAGLHGHVAAFIKQLVPAYDARIIDLGCGNGALLERLAEMGYGMLWGVDISPPASTKTIEFQQVDLDHLMLNVQESFFDLALGVEVIEHIENPGLLLEELARLIKPGGFVLFTTPNLHSAQAKLLFILTDRLKQFDAKGDPTHITPIVLFPFNRLLKRHGFTLINSWSFPEDGGSPTSRPALRLIARIFGVLRPSRFHGDTLCLLAKRDPSLSVSEEQARSAKAAQLTAHYSK